MFEIRLLRLEELKLLNWNLQIRLLKAEVSDSKFVFRLLRSDCCLIWELLGSLTVNHSCLSKYLLSLSGVLRQIRHRVELQYTASWRALSRWWSRNDIFLKNHRFPYEVLKCLDWQNFKMFPKPSFLYSQTIITTTTANRTAGPPWSKPELSIMFQSTAEL